MQVISLPRVFRREIPLRSSPFTRSGQHKRADLVRFPRVAIPCDLVLRRRFQFGLSGVELPARRADTGEKPPGATVAADQPLETPLLARSPRSMTRPSGTPTASIRGLA